MPKYICDSCSEKHSSLVELDTDQLLEDDHELCRLCGVELSGEVNYISKVLVNEELHKLINSQIVGCYNSGCRGCGSWDSVDKEWIGRELTGTLFDAFINIWSVVEDDEYKVLLEEVTEDELKFDDEFKCGYCGNSLVDWNDEITIKTVVRYIEPIPPLPAELRTLSITNAAEQIEYFRSDCSNCLIHLTKPGSVLESVDNVDYEPNERQCTAAEILYLIISTGTIKASQSQGMPTEAVCFTEKPLTALKDMLVGQEAQVRTEKNGIQWYPYGVMFEKNVAIEKYKAAPAVHVSSEEMNILKKSSSGIYFRTVRSGEKSNYIHEREWRSPTTVRFDSKDAIVIVPTWEQAAEFKKVFAETGIEVRGILPILDVFKLI